MFFLFYNSAVCPCLILWDLFLYSYIHIFLILKILPLHTTSLWIIGSKGSTNITYWSIFEKLIPNSLVKLNPSKTVT